MKLYLYPLLLSFPLFAFMKEPRFPPEKRPGDGIHYSYAGNDPQIKTARDKALEVLSQKEFYNGIKAKGSFDYTSEPAGEIANSLSNAELNVRIREYKGGEDTRTLAFVDKDFPTTIFINISKTEDRNVHSILNTLIHETIHILDRATPEARFGHGGNSSNGKKNSAPYWIGAYASKISSGGASVSQNALALKNRVEANPGDVVKEGDLVHLEETETIVDKMIGK